MIISANSIIFKEMLSQTEILETRGRIHLGLCCINNSLRQRSKISPFGETVVDKKLWTKTPIFTSRSCIRKTFTVDRAKELALQNLNDIIPMLYWNHEHGIRHFRLSSEMFPHFTDPETEPYSLDFAKDKLREIGKVARKLGHRLTFHPGQFNQIGAKSRDVFERTISDLKMHADILDFMGIDDNGILCIHGGGKYDDKAVTMRRWTEQFDELPSNVRRRLAIENCEKCYCVRDCLDLSEACNIPVIMDSHHYNCYERFNDVTQEDPHDLMEEVVESWGNRTPLVHVSDPRNATQFTAHHDYVKKIPDYFLEVPSRYGVDLHIEVEAKAKEAAIFQLMSTHEELFPEEDLINVDILRQSF